MHKIYRVIYSICFKKWTVWEVQDDTATLQGKFDSREEARALKTKLEGKEK